MAEIRIVELAVANSFAWDCPSKVTSIGSVSPLVKWKAVLPKPSSHALLAVWLTISETPLAYSDPAAQCVPIQQTRKMRPSYGVEAAMLKSFFVACLFQAALISIAHISIAHAGGPFGTIHVGAWNGGAYTDGNTGNYSHCAAGSEYASGVSLVVSQTASNAWLLGFGSTAFHFTKGDTLPIDVTFDGQSQAKLFATANSTILISAILPPNVARTFQKSSLMVAVARGTPMQFNLSSTGPLIAALANCVTRVKADGVNNAGDFAAPKAVAAKSDAPNGATAGPAPATPKPSRTVGKAGTGFVISAGGHIITSHHVDDGCTGDIRGNQSGQPVTTLRVVSSDE